MAQTSRSEERVHADIELRGAVIDSCQLCDLMKVPASRTVEC